MSVVLLDITVIFALAVAAVVLCHRVNLPSSIGLLLAGVIAGPDVLGLVRRVEQIELLSEIGVVLLLFVIGLEFSLGDLSHLKRQFLIGGSLQFFGTAAVVSAATILMGSTVAQSVYIGFIVALSSTAIVLRMLQERAELDAPHGRAVLATLIYQDIAVVPLLLTAPLLAGSGGGEALTDVAWLVAKVAGVGVFAFVAYRWLVPTVLERITDTHSSEAFLLGVITMCVGIALLTQSIGLSLALGAFLAGLILSESDYSHQAVTVMLPFRDVFLSLFFVSIGMLLDIQYFLDDPIRLVLLTLGVIIIKPIIAVGASMAFGLPVRSAVLAGVALGQIGEFSLVAARTGVYAGLFGSDVFQTVLDAAVLSMLATPALVAAGPKLAEYLSRTPLAKLERRGFTGTRLESAHSYDGHILIIGFGVTGSNVAKTARLAGVPYAILELNAGTVGSALKRGEPIHFGDATHQQILSHVDAEKARVIVVVIDDPAGARRIVELGRRIAPDAYILVRTRYLREVSILRDLGADEVIADELEVSIEVFSRALSRMLVPREDIKRLIGDVRQDWRRMSRSLAKDATSVPDLRIDVPDLATHTLRLTDRSALVGGTIADSGLRAEHAVTIIAVTREDEAVSNPDGSFVLKAGDVLFVVGPSEWDPATVT